MTRNLVAPLFALALAVHHSRKRRQPCLFSRAPALINPIVLDAPQCLEHRLFGDQRSRFCGADVRRAGTVVYALCHPVKEYPWLISSTHRHEIRRLASWKLPPLPPKLLATTTDTRAAATSNRELVSDIHRPRRRNSRTVVGACDAPPHHERPVVSARCTSDGVVCIRHTCPTWCSASKVPGLRRQQGRVFGMPCSLFDLAAVRRRRRSAGGHGCLHPCRQQGRAIHPP